MHLILKIEQDQDAESPASWQDEEVFLIADHRQFWVPPSKAQRRFDVASEIDRRRESHHVFLLEAYIHSGVVLALAGEGNFPDRQWDVSTLGAVFVSKQETPVRAEAKEMAKGLIEAWNQYLSGDVWGCVIADEEGNHIDSCWGFYGRKYAEAQGQEMLIALLKEESK